MVGPALDWRSWAVDANLDPTCVLTPFFWQLELAFLHSSGGIGQVDGTRLHRRRTISCRRLCQSIDDGRLPAPDFPNCSATAVVNGWTVEEPTILIWSRATQSDIAANATAAAVDGTTLFT
jgi:hypothetical protein